MEIVRGVVSIILALLIPFALQFFIYVLGAYLILDGVLDAIQLAMGRRETQRKFINYLFAVVSIALGLISFLLPRATLFLIVAVVSIRIILRSVKVILDARRSRRK